MTFLAGDNGTGKSTLIEAIAVAAGSNPEGGSTNFRFSTRATESSLGEHLRLLRGTRKPRTGFFLRAESFYNVATEIDRLGVADGYGGTSLHERTVKQQLEAGVRPDILRSGQIRSRRSRGCDAKGSGGESTSSLRPAHSYSSGQG
ncbi:AAA family ATPase [Micromonospora sp. NPDC048843]|uniref:AAA family ATPase n=1 Tax=Micromonospora sp. NPDC048843 TaxID=3155389 RepID=UPI00340B2CE6